MRNWKQALVGVGTLLLVQSLWWSSPNLAGAQDKVDAAELKRFQGKWEIVSQEKATGKVPTDEVSIVLLVVQDDRWNIKTRNGIEAMARIVLLDPKAKPARISLEIGGQTFHGIYRFDKDFLITNVADSNAPPPMNFRPTESTTGAVTTHRRKAVTD